jgi:serine/threonine protein kinase/Flp pilus assembly protein TadD
VLAALSHPNILAIFDVGSENGVSFVVMELLPGETLFSRIAQRRPDWPEAVRLGIEIADGLSAAHSRGIIHRDLKPENIFLTRDGHIKILDFGLARCSDDFTPAEDKFGSTAGLPTATGVVMGTVPYMSPEQLKGMHADARSDIFSFGCVLQETITGKSPFVRVTRAETVSPILTEATPSLKQFDPTIPAELDQAVKRCLNKQPDQRFQSARDLAFHLRQILNTFSSTSATTQIRRRAARFNRRSAQAAAAACVVFLFLVTFAHWIGTKRSSFVRPQFKSIAVLPLQNYSGDPQQEYFVDGMTDSVIADLGKIKDMRVISRTSVMPYKTSKKSMREIASELHADAVIEGSVMRSADRVRITVQLIDAARDQHLWSESYERELKNVFELQGQVAQAIAQQVHAVVTPEEQKRFATKRAIDPDAYDDYLRGRYFWNQFTEDGARKSVKFFQRAIEKEPSSAQAYAGLSEAYQMLLDFSLLSPAEVYPEAEAAARKAVELDSGNSQAHATMGWQLLAYDRDFVGAEREFRRAIELNASNSDAHDGYASYFAALGQFDQSIAETRKARDADPLSRAVNSEVGGALLSQQSL